VNPFLRIACLVIFAYLFGSIPFGLIIARCFKGIDVRKYGSGNIGAANVFRTVGPLAGFLTLFFDVGKGFLPVYLGKKLIGPEYFLALIGLGIMAMLGHSFSLFLSGKGGKAVSTSFGVIIGLVPQAAFFSFLVWLICVFIFRYISLASMAGAFSLPIFIFRFQKNLTFLGILIFLLVLFTHRSNIKRLLQGKENKISLKKK
jgi:glycerol-3-phosphate acyltransferase PlsY